jgi:hypothetical protein
VKVTFDDITAGVTPLPQVSAVINPDETVADTVNPDNAPPGTSISNVELFDPVLGFPSRPQDATPVAGTNILNSTIQEPEYTEPEYTEPEYTEPEYTEPEYTEPEYTEPEYTTATPTEPEYTEPEYTEPEYTLPDLSNGITDVTVPISSSGNTAGSSAVKLYLNSQVPNCTCDASGNNCSPTNCRKRRLIVRQVRKLLSANGCKLTVYTRNEVITSIPKPALISNPAQLAAGTEPEYTNGTIALPPAGESFDPTKPGRAGVRVTLRSVKPASTGSVSPLKADAGDTLVLAAPPQVLVDSEAGALTFVAGAQAANTGSTTGSMTLTVATSNVFDPPPAGLVGVTYGASLLGFTLQAVGGTGAYTWSKKSGALPDGLTLAGNGLISGTPTLKGLFTFTVQVQDAASHTNTQTLSIQINQLEITGVSAFQTGSPGDTVLKGSDSLTVNVSVYNNGAATVNNVGTTALAVVNQTGTATASCPAAVPASSNMIGNAIQLFTYTCTVGGDGTMQLSVQAGVTINSFIIVPGSGTSNSITVDSTAPDTFITANPPLYAGAGASFSFTGTDNLNAAASLTFECSLDNAAFATCTSPTSYAGLGDGSHTFRVRAIDQAGNADATPASYSWTVDTVPPILTLTFSPNTPDGSNGWWKTPGGVPFLWTCTDNGGSGIDPTFNGGCPSVLSGTVTAQGTTNFTDQVRDLAGNLSVIVNRNLMLDNIAPSAAITSPVGGATYTFEMATPAAAYSCSDAVPGSGLATPCVGTVANGASFSTGLPLGTKTFTVTATDVAGNVGVAAVNYNVVAYSFIGTAFPDGGFFGAKNRGAAVPFRWQLQNINNVFLTNLDSLTKITARPLGAPTGNTCAPATPDSTGEVVVFNPGTGFTGGSDFRYSTTTNEFQLNWNSEVGTAPAPLPLCYALQLYLKDSTIKVTTVLIN